MQQQPPRDLPEKVTKVESTFHAGPDAHSKTTGGNKQWETLMASNSLQGLDVGLAAWLPLILAH